MGLLHHNVRTGDYLAFAEEERPLAVQLFADSPEAMARAAEMVLSRPVVPDLLDINMGCPVRKVVKTGAGSALMGDPDRAVAVAAAVVRVAAQSGRAGHGEAAQRPAARRRPGGGAGPPAGGGRRAGAGTASRGRPASTTGARPTTPSRRLWCGPSASPSWLRAM